MAVASKASAALEALRAAALAAGVDVSGWAGSVGPAAAAVPGPAGAPLEWTAFGAAVAADWDDWADEGFDVVDALPPDGDDDDDDDDGSDDDVARAALSSANRSPLPPPPPRPTAPIRRPRRRRRRPRCRCLPATTTLAGELETAAHLSRAPRPAGRRFRRSALCNLGLANRASRGLERCKLFSVGGARTPTRGAGRRARGRLAPPPHADAAASCHGGWLARAGGARRGDWWAESSAEGLARLGTALAGHHTRRLRGGGLIPSHSRVPERRGAMRRCTASSAGLPRPSLLRPHPFRRALKTWSRSTQSRCAPCRGTEGVRIRVIGAVGGVGGY